MEVGRTEGLEGLVIRVEVGRTEGLEGLVKVRGWKDRGPGWFGEGWRLEGQRAWRVW